MPLSERSQSFHTAGSVRGRYRQAVSPQRCHECGQTVGEAVGGGPANIIADLVPARNHLSSLQPPRRRPANRQVAIDAGRQTPRAEGTRRNGRRGALQQ